MTSGTAAGGLKRLAEMNAIFNAAIDGTYSVYFADGHEEFVKATSHEAAERKASARHPGVRINFSMDLLLSKLARTAIANLGASS
jgi:hypothetical protein